MKTKTHHFLFLLVSEHSLPDEDYRARFDADLKNAAQLMPKEWRTMHLQAATKQTASRMYWEILCATFIENGKVVRHHRHINFGDHQVSKQNFKRNMCSFVAKTGPASGNSWRPFCGGPHMVKENDGTYSLVW